MDAKLGGRQNTSVRDVSTRRAKMEEADQILLLTLGRLGCTIPEGITSVADVVENDALVPICSSCLRVIQPDDAVPPPLCLPPEMSGRFRVGTELAARLQACGYSRELGFHQFLYPAEQDTRAILKFLVDRMPKTLEVDKTSSSGNEQNGRGRLVNASERAASGVGDSLRQGSEMRAITSANSDTGAARLRAAVQRMELTAVAASSARARRRSPKSSTPFWTVHLRADELKSSVPFTSQSPPAFVLSSTLEYVVQDAAATLSRAEAQLHKLTATDGTLGPTVATLDADGNQLDPDAFRMLVASGYRGKIGKCMGKSGTGGQRSEHGVELTSDRKQENTEDVVAGLDISRMEIVNLGGASSAKSTAATLLVNRESELEVIRERLREAETAAAEVEMEQEGATRLEEEATRRKGDEQDKMKGLEAEYVLHKQTTGLMLGTDRPIAESEAELHRVLDTAEQRARQLQDEWDSAKTLIEAELSEHTRAADARRRLAKEQLGHVHAFRVELRDLAIEARSKDEEQIRLMEEYNVAPKNFQRASFVRRINEIVKNVKKQEGEIAKIVGDTRAMQRELDGARESMGRAYALVDDTLYRDAKGGDELCKEAYLHLAGIHGEFAELTEKVEETGQCGKTQRELERKLEELLKQPENVEQVMADITSIEAEIEFLAKELQV